MGRPQGFDTEQVVRAARTVFWRQGFESASVPELERATGLARSSLYHAFGSKRGLFDAAVDSYLTEVVRPRLAPLLVEDVAPTALHDYLTGLRAALAAPRSPASENGCLLVNTAGSPLALDAAVAERVSAYRAELRHAFARGAAARNPEASAAEIDRLADTCTALVVTAFAMTRVDNAAALGAIDTALALVD